MLGWFVTSSDVEEACVHDGSIDQVVSEQRVAAFSMSMRNDNVQHQTSKNESEFEQGPRDGTTGVWVAS